MNHGQETGAEMRRVSAIRMAAVEKHPFWGYLLMQCRIIPSPGMEAIAATDCRRNIYLNPLRSSSLSMRELGFVLLHEVGHHIQASFDRQQGRDRFLWNCATDLAINRMIADIPDPTTPYSPMYHAPAGALLDRSMDHQVAEAIYEEILGDRRFAEKRSQVVRVRVTLQGGGGRGDTRGPETRDHDGTSGRKGRQRKGLPEGGNPAPEDGGPSPGEDAPAAVAGGIDVTIEDHGGGIDVHLPSELSGQEREALEDMVRAAVRHWMAGDRRGHLPGAIQRGFSGGKAALDWRRMLRNHMAAALGREEFTRSRPNRRWLAAGAIVPGFHDEKVGRIVVALDTSGSMSAGSLREVIAEIRPLMDEVEDMDLIVADARVHEVVSLEDLPGWLGRGKARGGGGTSHIPVFEWIAGSGRPPDLFIGLTDLFTELPARRPPYPVLWVCPEHHGEPPWGRVVVKGNPTARA